MRIYPSASLSTVMSCAVVAICLGQASPGAHPKAPAVAQDLILGSWTLDVAKSTYKIGPAPRSQTRIYARHPDGIKTTIDEVDGRGVQRTVEFVAEYDSIESPVSGSATVDGIALKRVDGYVADAELSHAGKLIASARRAISPDGQTLTITVRQANGTTSSIAVYRRGGGA